MTPHNLTTIIGWLVRRLTAMTGMAILKRRFNDLVSPWLQDTPELFEARPRYPGPAKPAPAIPISP